MKIQHSLWKTSLLATGTSLFALGIALPANAQDAEPITVAEEAEDDLSVQDRIIVTGSRIARRELSTPAPIVTVGAEDLLKSGETDIVNFLRDVPALFLSDNANQSLVNGGAQGASVPNLRGLGTNRTLTLQNGRRHVGGFGGSAAVDASTIPVSLIERVEVLTGSASSVYGADAVSGVLNFVLRDDFEGFASRGQFSISDEGDAEEYYLSFTAGTNFAEDRGNVYASIDFTRTTPLTGFDRPGLAGSTRPRFVDATDELIAAAGAPDGTQVLFASDTRFPFSSAGGVIDVGGLFNGLPSQFFDSTTGELRDFDFGTLTGDFFTRIGGDGIILTTDRDFIVPEQDRTIVNVGSSFKVNQYVNFFAEGKYARSDSVDLQGVNGFNDFIAIRPDNAFIPTQLQAIIAADPNGANADIFISRDGFDESTTPFTQILRETYRGVVGFEGEFNNGWTYDVAFNYGRTETDATATRTRIDDRLFAASDAISLDAAAVTAFNAAGGAAQAFRNGALVALNGDAQAGDIVCRSEFEADTGAALSAPPRASFPNDGPAGFVSFAPGDGQCVPTSLFGENAINADAANFAFIQTAEQTTIEQIVAGFNLAGDSSTYFELPAGPIGFAVGFEYRDESSNFQPDIADATGISFAAFRNLAAVPTVGSFDTTEVFGEVSVPLLKDYPPFNELTLDASIRYADNSASGSNVTWGTGLTWEVVPDLRFRGSYGEAVRAANIFELFSPLSPEVLGASADPCNPANIDLGPAGGVRRANCDLLVGPNFISQATAGISGTTGGNPNLEPEESTTYTAGIILQPRFIPGLTVTADYFDIEIEGAIASLLPFTIAENCVDAVSIDNAFCDAIDRDPITGTIIGFRSGQQNIGAIETNGVDFSVRYNFELEDLIKQPLGDISLSVIGTRLIQDRFFADQNDLTTENPNEFEFGRPRLNITGGLDWAYSNFSVGWQTRYQTSTFLVGQTDVNSPRQLGFPSRSGDSFVHDLNASYNVEIFGKEQTFFAGINNVADRSPTLPSQTIPVSAVGRTFFVGFQALF